MFISKSTRRNWDRLKTEESSRLTRRANKRLSAKKIMPVEAFINKDNRLAVLDILSALDDSAFSMTDLLCSVAENLFSVRGILYNSNVQTVLAKYPYRRIAGVINAELPQDENDLLGIIYQAGSAEGKKNQHGSYYTPRKITAEMGALLTFENGEIFLDPCCGSGAFLLAVPCDTPQLLYGIDRDPFAVMIAEFNMLLRFHDKNFIPNIFCGDFLTDNPLKDHSFDYIVTNPPWGAFSGIVPEIAEITSQETFSLFFVKAFRQLKENGIVRFLLPEAILNVKIHKDIRRFMLENCCLENMVLHGRLFSGVTTGFVDLMCRKGRKNDTVTVKKDGSAFEVDTAVFTENKNNVFSLLTPQDRTVIEQCRELGRYTLEKSRWALGIVTGDNRGKLKAGPEPHTEAIYTGREIVPYGLKAPQNYILYDRSALQQVAGEEYYRAAEKLVYKFISNKLVFAYDDKQRLFLNSANILIPEIPGMSIKTVLAFLNSELFTFLYQKMFGEVKILKGNLLQLPFPDISREADRRISALTDRVIAGNESYETLQDEIYAQFKLTADQISYIKKRPAI